VPNKPFNPIARENARSGLTAALGTYEQLRLGLLLMSNSLSSFAFGQECSMSELRTALRMYWLQDACSVQVKGSRVECTL